ncbi:hypothetical protein [uncultured Algibacter sp.]|uniref:hypothetical protein n=1 Tax=uncultured Algibacter sp. TaxID=298659 RepID=UPI00262EEDC7|nr:hypothetical protein [uncultured Algibacter sp.]
MLEITNNSNKINEFKLFVKPAKCKDDYNNVVKNQKGFLDNDNVVSEKKIDSKISSSLTFEIYNKTLSENLSKILLQPKKSLKFYLKITRENNSEIGQWKCSKLIAKLLNKKNSKRKSVIIKSFMADSNTKGH